MRIRETLRRKNQDLKQDLENVKHIVSIARIVEELEPYRAALLTRTLDLIDASRQNLAWLDIEDDILLPDVLSETSILLQRVRLIKLRYLRGLYRTTNWDRVCLQTIAWVHRRHEQTVTYPAVFADDDVSTIPSKGLPFYFFPCLEQRGLRFQPLFFHEFGHVLYKCHEQELDSLVGDFQQIVEAELLPASQRNDQYAQEQARLRQSIVETWYKWVQEFFCDAVGLSIGGPCFLNAFSDYIGRLQTTDYFRQASDLHGSSHPVSCLRLKLLAERAERAGLGRDAENVVRNWNDVANLLGAGEDYHGFYTDSIKTSLVKTVDDMMVEASPYQCSEDDAAGIGWEGRPTNLVALLNKAWAKYMEDPNDFQSWEAKVLVERYGLQELVD